jgi:hypothetical protein
MTGAIVTKSYYDTWTLIERRYPDMGVIDLHAVTMRELVSYADTGHGTEILIAA